MKKLRMLSVRFVWLAFGFAAAPGVSAQLVINEFVINERDYNNTAFPDPGEFVELYNAGIAPVDLTNWAIATIDLTNGFEDSVYTIPGGHSIAPGDYFVIGQFGTLNVDYPLFGEIWTDDSARVLELRDPTANTVDAVAYEVYRTGATGFANATAAQQAQVGSGYQGRLFSLIDTPTPSSLGRYRDGRDTDSTGRDFGHLARTPGTSNDVPLFNVHSVPDIDGSLIGSDSPGYHGSFVMPKVVDPTVNDGVYNKRALPASPQGGNAIVAWDPDGGGNTVYSNELTNGFDLFAYFDTEPLGIPLSGQQYEFSTYGIGNADGRFSIGNPIGTFSTGSVTDSSNTGIGWFYQKHQNGGTNSSKLLLIDFGDGGNSLPAAGEWEVIEEIDVSGMSSGWFRLGLQYDPATGDVWARFDTQTFTFNTEADLSGAFYVGYREQTTAQTSHPSLLNPPLYDLFIPGDYDNDGDVDSNDYAEWQAKFGGTATPAGSGADGNSSGTVNAADYVFWRDHLETLVVAEAGNTVVPEPSGLFLLTAGIFSIAVWRKSRR